MSGLGPTICGMASRVPSADLQAARRYGRLVDPIAAQYKNPLTGGRLSGEALLLKLAKGESGFSATADSGKAHGTTQFTPGSRQTAISRFGVDPWRSKDEAYHAAALHLLGKINGSKGLEGYNPGSSSYPSYILNQAVGNVGGSLGSGGSGGGGSTTTTTTTGSPGAPDLGAGSTAATDLVSSLLAARQPAAAPVSAPAAPSFSAQAVMPQGYQAPSGGSPQAPPDVSALLAAVRTAGVGPAQDGGQTTTATTSSGGSSGGLSSAGGQVSVSPTANRAGVGLTPGIQKVLRAVAGVAGPITVGTGTNHNRLTVDGNVSDHYSGNAADLPTTPGSRNIQLGRQALIAAGMPRAQAEKAKGGIYNIPYGKGRRIQVIFNTNEGGDHHGHVHVGVTGLSRR